MRMSANWQGSLANYEEAQRIVNGVEWNLSTHPRQNGEWALFGGDQEIATFSSRAEMKAFVMGMALAIGVLPDEVIQHIKRFIE